MNKAEIIALLLCVTTFTGCIDGDDATSTDNQLDPVSNLDEEELSQRFANLTASYENLAADLSTLAANYDEALSQNNIESKVVSMPCQELFDKQSDDFKKDILDKESLIVTIEAGDISSWKKYSGDKGISLGIDRFGESAPYKKVYEHLNLSVEKIVLTIQENLRK